MQLSLYNDDEYGEFGDIHICGCLYNPGCIASDWMDCVEWWADVWKFERRRVG